MNRGVPPTARKARTGEFTPPGISVLARSNAASEWAIELTCPEPVEGPELVTCLSSVERAYSKAQYVKITSAPARRMATSDSAIAASRLIQPCAAAASTIAYSPDTL